MKCLESKPTIKKGIFKITELNPASMPKDTRAWCHRKTARHRNPPPEKNVRKAVCNKTKRTTKNEMVG
jgi:hypothetical protein